MNESLICSLKSFVTEKEIIDCITETVKIPSYNGIKNQETSVANCIHNLFEKEGIESEIVHVEDGRCNVIAKLKGNGNGKSLLFTGHTDTVPPYDMMDAFDLKNDGQNLIGRGVLDMKGPLVCMIFGMIALKRADIKLKGDLIFAGVIDEEEKSLGTIDLLEKGIKADAAIVGEPTDLDICVAHKGLEWFELNFEGKTVHGGKQKEGINAINLANKFINRVEEKLLPKIERETYNIKGTDVIIESSMNYGTIKGGTQPSTVAGDCVITLDRRWVPKITYEEVVNGYKEIIDELSKEDDKYKCTLKVMAPSVMKQGYVHAPMETDIHHPIVELTKLITKEVYNKIPNITYFPAWTDGGLLSSYGNIPTIVFAPGVPTTAHSAIEQLRIDQILPATLIYAKIAYDFCN